MSSGSVYYAAYKAQTEQNNVEPIIISGFEETFTFRKTVSVDWNKPNSRQLRFWDVGTVYYLNDGRVIECSQTNSAVGTPLIAIFNNKTDYFNYRKAMPLNYYLNH